jgi:hypothetical protein
VNDDQEGAGGAVNRERRSWKVALLGAQELAPQVGLEPTTLRLAAELLAPTSPQTLDVHWARSNGLRNLRRNAGQNCPPAAYARLAVMSLIQLTPPVGPGKSGPPNPQSPTAQPARARSQSRGGRILLDSARPPAPLHSLTVGKPAAASLSAVTSHRAGLDSQAHRTEEGAQVHGRREGPGQYRSHPRGGGATGNAAACPQLRGRGYRSRDRSGLPAPVPRSRVPDRSGPAAISTISRSHNALEPRQPHAHQSAPHSRSGLLQHLPGRKPQERLALD